jgi:putative ABC transport system permease protein
VRVNGQPFTVVGVMPARFEYPAREVAAWVPLRLNYDSLWTRNNHYLTLVGRLAPDATVRQARRALRIRRVTRSTSPASAASMSLADFGLRPSAR